MNQQPETSPRPTAAGSVAPDAPPQPPPDAPVELPDARQRLGEAATRLFSEKGYHGVSVREIVEAAGVTKPTLYYYYGNKEHLFERLIRESIEDFRARLEWAVAQPGTIRERLGRICGVFLDDVDRNPERCRLHYHVYFSADRAMVDVDFDAYHRRIMELVRHVFAEGIAANELMAGDPGLMAFNFIGAIHLFITAKLFQPAVLPTEEPGNVLVDMVLNGMMKRSHSGQGGSEQ